MQEMIPAEAGEGRAPIAVTPQEKCALTAQVEAALAGPMTREALDAVARMIWGALGAGQLTEAEAARLDGLVRDRRARIGCGRAGGISHGVGLARPPRAPRPRSPDRQASIERRRRVAASGAVPPELAAQFTQGEVAVLSVVGREAARGRPICDWPMDRIAALAGVSRTVARGALRLAQRLGLLRVQERRRRAARSDTNVVTITAKGWWRWLKRAAAKTAKTTVSRQSRDAECEGGGCGNPKATCTKVFSGSRKDLTCRQTWTCPPEKAVKRSIRLQRCTRKRLNACTRDN